MYLRQSYKCLYECEYKSLQSAILVMKKFCAKDNELLFKNIMQASTVTYKNIDLVPSIPIISLPQ